MPITNQKKILLINAWNYCDEKDKSTEFMFQYCSDMSRLPYDQVVEYICSDEGQKEREYYLKHKRLSN